MFTKLQITYAYFCTEYNRCNIKFSFPDIVYKEIDKKINTGYQGLGIDSDLESECESDNDYHSADEAQERKEFKCDYDIHKMFDIIWKRDHQNWSLNTIHNKYKKISNEPYGRVELSR